MIRLVSVVLLLGACGFQIRGGSNGQDAGSGDDDAAIADGSVDDMVIDEPPPIDGNHVDWWDPAWMQRRRITLDTSTLTGAVTDFPVLVRIPSLVGAQVNGADVRFVSIDGTTIYPYEHDSFNAAGMSLAWVRMTLASTADTELWVYYGNQTAQAVSSGAAVFASNHLSVHHLGGLLDATNNGHNAAGGTGTTPATNVTGRIGGSRTFDGTDDFLTLNDSDGDYDFTNQLYASAWIRVVGFEDAYQAIITKGDSSWRLARADGGDGVSFGWTNGMTNDNLQGTVSVRGGEWHHVAIVQTPTTKYVYVDGVEDEFRNDSDQLDSNNLSVRIGMNQESDNAPRYWHGDIDEVRISASARNAAWIFAERKTTDPAFITVGPVENY